ncbi:hypothetical protein [Streptomyces neyagawaensis]|nr:hypothetical protein [Streptomyces neyagawaensis]MDE1681843.1 hypothetical protein [Streptomyces neyagawaensis]
MARGEDGTPGHRLAVHRRNRLVVLLDNTVLNVAIRSLTEELRR